MPSTYAHLTFGLEVLDRYPEDRREIVWANMDLFLIGLHGPDILFYYKPLHSNPISAIGFGQHDKPAKEFFGPAAELVRNSPEELRAAQQAYLLGFLCHFALDQACHGYIENKIHLSGVSHAEIEMEFDRQLLTDRGLDPFHQSLTYHIRPTVQSCQVIAPFFPPVTAKQVEKSLKSMIRSVKLLQAPHGWQRWVLDLAFRLSGNYDERHGMVMSRKPDPACQDSSLRLIKLMHQAVETCLDLTEAYFPCLEKEGPLPEQMDLTFGPGPGWEKIPVLSYEEEVAYEF